jgi:hypothetical protein
MEAAAGDTLDASANEVATPHIQERKARTHKHPHPRNAPSITAYFKTPSAILHHVWSSVDQSVIRMALADNGNSGTPLRKVPDSLGK